MSSVGPGCGSTTLVSGMGHNGSGQQFQSGTERVGDPAQKTHLDFTGKKHLLALLPIGQVEKFQSQPLDQCLVEGTGVVGHR